MEEQIALEVNDYDNEISIMYKWAISFEIPVKYLIIEETTQEKFLDVNFQSLFIEVQNHIDKSLIDIYKYLNTFRERILDLNLEQDLPYIYYYIHSQGNEKSHEELENLVDEIIDYFNEMKVTQPVTDYHSWVPSFNNWLDEYGKEYEKDLEIYEFILNIQQTLNKYPALQASPLAIERVLLETSIPGVKPEDGIELFDHMKLSYSLPYAQYNEAEVNEHVQKYFKVYVGHEQVQPKIYDLIIPNLKKASRPSTLYATLWSGTGEIWKPIVNNYSHVTYHLDSNQLQINIPIVISTTRQSVLEEVEKSLGHKLGPNKEIRITGYFFIYDVELVEVSFLDLMLNEDLFNSYLFISESKTPVSQKERLRYRFKSLLTNNESSENPFEEGTKIPSSITFSLYQMYMGTEETHGGHTYPSGTPYLRINILEGKNKEEVNHFIIIFSHLMSFYRQHSSDIIKTYQEYFPNISYKPERTKIMSSVPSTPRVSELSTPITSRPSTPTGPEGKEEEEEVKPIRKSHNRPKKGSALEALQSRASDLFGHNYSRSCQGTQKNMRQPIILSDEQAKAWENETFIFEGQERKREILVFSYKDGNLLIGCPNNEYPFPGLKENIHDNKKEFPFVPCCFKRDQVNKMKNKVATMKIKAQGKETKSSGLSISYIIKSEKVLDPDRFGYSPKSISTILEKYRKPDENLKIVRYGVISSPSSLIHCLFVALQDQRYLKLSPADKVNFVDSFRKSMISSINISLLKQELYDYSDEEIGRQLTNREVFFDAKLFYRALEEIFNVNLFVFTHDIIQETHLPSEDIKTLEIPRSKSFHLRQTRMDRMSVMVYKNWGSEKNVLNYSQYELLVDMNVTTKATTKVFKKEMTKILYQILHNVSPIYSWKFNEDEDLEGTVNFLNTINYRQIIGLPLSSQLLDEYGKLRGYNYLLEGGLKMTVIVPPSQPENVPVGKIESLPYEEALKRFGQASRIVKEEDRLIGLWFPVYQDPHGLYVQVTKVPIPASLADLPEGHPNPLVGIRGVNMINRLTKLKRIINLLLQIVLWAFHVAFQENNEISVDQFAEQYFIGDDVEIRESLGLYDFSRFPRKLPMMNKMKDVIEYLKNNVEGLIVEDRIYLYSTKLIDGVMYFLNQFVKNHKGLKVILPSYLSNYYMTEKDFQAQDKVLIFLNESDFKGWEETLGRNEHNILRFILSPNYKNEIDPYFYKSSEDKLYLIQNVLEGNLNRALAVAHSWRDKKVNPGYSSPMLKELVPYKIYGISNANTMALIESSPEPQAYEILNYGSNYYAAILPMGSQS